MSLPFVVSSNVLAALGYNFTSNPDFLRVQIEQAGICFLHAPLFHPAMKNVAPVRKNLGIKTFFNMLGPLVNPAMPTKQIIGVFNLKLARVYGYLHQQLDKQYGIIHALDGYDEVSLTGGFKLITNSGEQIITPEEIGFERITPDMIYGGETIDQAAEIFMNVLNGKGTSAQNLVVIANAGLAIHIYSGISIEEAMVKATDSLVSGQALASFQKLIKISNEQQ